MKNNMNNKKRYLIIVIFILYFALAFQEPRTLFNEQESKDDKNIITYLSTNNSVVIEWNRTWGGSKYDDCYGVAVDSIDNIYLAGYTESFGAGQDDMVLVKYDSSGVQQWNCTWGGGDSDHGYRVAVDSSNNVYVVGLTNSFGAGSSDLVIVKYDSIGIQQWNRTGGGINIDLGEGVAVDSSDNVYLVGETLSFGAGSSDLVIVKYDSSGVQQWNRTWGGGDSDHGYGVALDSFDNVYVAGATFSFGAGQDDMVLVKYDNSGVQQWNRTWGGSKYDECHVVAVDSIDNIYLAGYTESFGAVNYDMVLVKYGPDIYDPIVSINSPSPDDKFGDEAPDYNILIVEPNLESMWYTIDGGITNYTIYQLSGTINQSAWDVVPYGSITFEFFAKDLAENIGHSGVVVQKVKKKEEPAIPGYNLLFLISAISIITVISLKKKYK